MQELRAQIQAQLKLADTLKKISETAGEKYKDKFLFSSSFSLLSLGIGDIMQFLGKTIVVVLNC